VTCDLVIQGRIALRCRTCGKTLFRSQAPEVPYEDVLAAITMHLAPRMEEMARELLREISVKDIIRGLRLLRRKT
jgi:hypothetical protein